MHVSWPQTAFLLTTKRLSINMQRNQDFSREKRSVPENGETALARLLNNESNRILPTRSDLDKVIDNINVDGYFDVLKTMDRISKKHNLSLIPSFESFHKIATTNNDSSYYRAVVNWFVKRYKEEFLKIHFNSNYKNILPSKQFLYAAMKNGLPAIMLFIDHDTDTSILLDTVVHYRYFPMYDELFKLLETFERTMDILNFIEDLLHIDYFDKVESKKLVKIVERIINRRGYSLAKRICVRYNVKPTEKILLKFNGYELTNAKLRRIFQI